MCNVFVCVCVCLCEIERGIIQQNEVDKGLFEVLQKQEKKE